MRFSVKAVMWGFGVEAVVSFGVKDLMWGFGVGAVVRQLGLGL